MPPLVLLAAIGAGCYAAYRLGARWMAGSETAKKPDAAHANKNGATASPARDLGDLEWDAQAGVYRPKRR